MACDFASSQAIATWLLFSAGSSVLPRGLGLATAITSAAFFPHFEQRIRGASALSVIDQPTRRAKASGSISRHAPQSQITHTRN